MTVQVQGATYGAAGEDTKAEVESWGCALTLGEQCGMEGGSKIREGGEEKALLLGRFDQN